MRRGTGFDPCSDYSLSGMNLTDMGPDYVKTLKHMLTFKHMLKSHGLQWNLSMCSDILPIWGYGSHTDLTKYQMPHWDVHTPSMQ